jgi:hypothetical protein
MNIAVFPLRMVRACIKFPQSRIHWRGNQFYSRQIVYGSLAPGWQPRALLISKSI